MKIIIFLLILTVLSLQAERGLQLEKKMKNEQRTALIIGNSIYNSQRLPKLKNPVNDSRAMKIKLEQLGFKVFYGENLNVREMNKKLDQFKKRLLQGGVGLFYFAGHGIEFDGKNYLIGKDSDIETKEDVPYASLALNKVIDKMSRAGNGLNIILLDACRSDPFSRSTGGGLAEVEDARGMFIAYATSPGDVASDGVGKHGVFTQEILKNIDAKGIPIERLFKRIKKDVYVITHKRQRPWTYDDLMGDFFFVLPNDFTKKIKQTKQSSFSFKNKQPTKFELTINTEPYDAKVSITNIVPIYRDGIKLKKGIYRIKISKEGYYTKEGDINLVNNLNINVVLTKIKKIRRYTPKANYSYSRNKSNVNTKACAACHGQNFEKHALGRSKIVKYMSHTEIAAALKGYKAGTYGGPMKGVMKGQVARYSDSDLENVSRIIGQ